MASTAGGRRAGARVRPRVLIVDVDDSMRKALARTLRLAGFDVEVFRYAEAVLARGVVERDVCLVLDVDAPGIEGITLARSLRAIDWKIATIFITALGADDVAPPLARLSPLAVLCKPFSKEELLDAVGRACREAPR
jgi:FixJ family two-component response regulator